MGREASGLVGRLVSDFFLEKDRGEDVSMNTCRSEISIMVHGRRTENGA